MNKQRFPGFTAEASLHASSGGSRRRGRDEGESGRVVAAQFGWAIDVWLGCPPGQRRTYVAGKFQTKYCDVPVPPTEGRIDFEVKSIPCGTEYVGPHWECQPWLEIQRDITARSRYFG